MVDDRTIALAIDIGGTFTDLAAVDRRDGSLVLAKVDTTPSRLQQGVLTALERSEISPDDVGAFVHGSTVVINAITERRGARTALVTTEGFRDVLEIGRANRPDLYNLSYRKPKPFVPRRLRLEVRERISHTGAVLVPLDEPAVGVGRRSPARARRRRSGDLLPPRLDEPRARAPSRRPPVGAAGRRRDRRLARGELAMARVRTHEHDRPVGVRETHRRLVPGGPPLGASRGRRRGTAVRDAVERRGVVVRARRRSADHAARVRPGRRGNRRGRARPAARRRGRPHPRHRGDHGEDLGRPEGARPDRDAASRRADADHGRLPDPGAGRRDRRSRRRRRLDRVGRRGRRPPRRSSERGRRTGSGVLRPRWRRADAHRREPRGRTPRSRVLPRRRDVAGRRCGASKPGTPRRADGRRRRNGGERRPSVPRRADVARAPPGHASAGSRSSRLHVRGVRRRGPAARGAACARARRLPDGDPARPGPLLGARDAARRPPCGCRPNARRASRPGNDPAVVRRTRDRGRGRARTGGGRAPGRAVRPPAVRGPGAHARGAARRRADRRRAPRGSA